MWILVAATLFGVVYTSAGAQDMVMGMVQNLQVNRCLILATMQIILLIFGMFMDDYAVLTICAPIFIPIAVYLGFNPEICYKTIVTPAEQGVHSKDTWIPACQTVSQLTKLRILLFCHSGLDPESSAFLKS